jgi:hypothetical protein
VAKRDASDIRRWAVIRAEQRLAEIQAERVAITTPRAEPNTPRRSPSRGRIRAVVILGSRLDAAGVAAVDSAPRRANG